MDSNKTKKKKQFDRVDHDWYTQSVEKLARVDIGGELKIGKGRSVIDLFKPGRGVEPTLGYFISKILPNVYVLASLILFFLLIGGGFKVIVSAGQENPEEVAKGKKAIGAAIAGFIIIFASYWIMEIIEVLTGLDILGGGGL